jgi:hypothetical protein
MPRKTEKHSTPRKSSAVKLQSLKPKVKSVKGLEEREVKGRVGSVIPLAGARGKLL